jgi:hypothetical protein
MAFDIEVTNLQTVTGDATGTVVVPDPDNFNTSRFEITTTDTCNFRIQQSSNNTTWWTLKTITGIAATTIQHDIQILDRPWPFVRINWDTNGGNLTVDLQQLYERTETTV